MLADVQLADANVSEVSSPELIDTVSGIVHVLESPAYAE